MFHEKLKQKIHIFITDCYELFQYFPQEEKFGLVSQLRRASISIMLNYVEGYARRRDKVKLNFYEISHGSSQECKYILYFACTQKWISDIQYRNILMKVDEIGKMLWSTIVGLEKRIEDDSHVS